MRRPRTTVALFYFRATNQISASEYVDWAVSLLKQGLDSPSLRILAGLDSSNLFEAEDYLRRTLRELRIDEPDFETSARTYACDLCKAIMTGTLAPRDGVAELCKVWVATDYATEYSIWPYLNDIIDLVDPESSEDIEDQILKEAKQFIEIVENHRSELTDRPSP